MVADASTLSKSARRLSSLTSRGMRLLSRRPCSAALCMRISDDMSSLGKGFGSIYDIFDDDEEEEEVGARNVPPRGKPKAPMNRFIRVQRRSYC